ncbi:hypothetical protein EDB92DRAFT_525842 [Lactarius akahatsu]|uniref:Uncharacterized protein n=1 Tax=Lactarius akahatsu TaxID=416441 RepID=A0AAD4LJ59_9AGAM|nr:hypothetical protein EDB92DRAFT_525842 [Lactarius akahatsu]
MPALIPMHNTLGALFIGTILASILYGVTWLQVYSYYSGHCSKDRWPLRLVDSANLIFVVYTTYHIGVTNFGDYLSNAFKPLAWSQPATTLSAIVLEVPVQHFYAYRIYRLQTDTHSREQSVVSLTSLGIGVEYSVKVLKHIHDPGIHFQGLSIAALSCKVLCDVFITSGMVYYLLSNRTQVRSLNSRDNLRERLDGQDGACYNAHPAQGTHRPGYHGPVRHARYDGNEHQHGCPEGSPTTFSLLRHVFRSQCDSFRQGKAPCVDPFRACPFCLDCTSTIAKTRFVFLLCFLTISMA